MDVHLNSAHGRLKDGSSANYGINMENCTQVCGQKNNGIESKCESHLSINPENLSHELREKLRIACSGSGVGLINGCNKSLYSDVKNVDVTTVNGVSKCHTIDLIHSHVDYCSDRLRDQSEHHETPQTTVEESCSSECETKVDFAVSVSDPNNRDLTCSKEPVTITNNISDGVITYVGYESEKQMPDIMRLIQKDLSEPYSIYTYRYFIHNWPKLCFLAHDGDNCVGAIVCKLDLHKKHSRRGYIAMLAVDERYRKRKIGSNLVLKAIKAMVQDNADEVVLETEITNKPALRLYENLGFVRDKRLFRYYLNGVDALRLKLWLR